MVWRCGDGMKRRHAGWTLNWLGISQGVDDSLQILEQENSGSHPDMKGTPHNEPGVCVQLIKALVVECPVTLNDCFLLRFSLKVHQALHDNFLTIITTSYHHKEQTSHLYSISFSADKGLRDWNVLVYLTILLHSICSRNEPICYKPLSVSVHYLHMPIVIACPPRVHYFMCTETTSTTQFGKHFFLVMFKHQSRQCGNIYIVISNYFRLTEGCLHSRSHVAPW